MLVTVQHDWGLLVTEALGVGEVLRVSHVNQLVLQSISVELLGGQLALDAPWEGVDLEPGLGECCFRQVFPRSRR